MFYKMGQNLHLQESVGCVFGLVKIRLIVQLIFFQGSKNWRQRLHQPELDAVKTTDWISSWFPWWFDVEYRRHWFQSNTSITIILREPLCKISSIWRIFIQFWVTIRRSLHWEQSEDEDTWIIPEVGYHVQMWSNKEYFHGRNQCIIF